MFVIRFVFACSGDNRDLHVLTHSFPTRRSSDLNLGSDKARIYLKREDLLHGGAHKTNQVLGQALLAKRMGKTRIIAETGAGQHGVATAIVGALFGLQTRIYMGAHDVERQKLKVFRMWLMGAEVMPGESGGRGLKDEVNEALRDWTASFADTHRSEEHTSELQSLMRISYAVFCLKKK